MSVTGTVNWTPSRFLLVNLSNIAPSMRFRLYDTNGNIQMDQSISMSSGNIKTTNNQVIITVQHTPKESYCLKEITVEAVLSNGSMVPFIDIVFMTNQPYLEKDVTYTITITVSYSQPTSVAVTAPTGTCTGGTPPSSSS